MDKLGKMLVFLGAEAKMTSLVKALRNVLVVGLALLVFRLDLTAQVSFAPAVSYGVGKNPHSVVAADINGDVAGSQNCDILNSRPRFSTSSGTETPTAVIFPGPISLMISYPNSATRCRA